MATSRVQPGHTHTFSCFETSRWPEFCHGSYDLMSGDDREPDLWKLSLDCMQVGMANTTDMDTDKDLTGVRLGDRAIDQS